MSKLLRNTFFTIVALILTTIGLGWNKDVAKKNDPISISEAVLASQTETETQPQQDQLLPLKIEFSRQVVRLGQTQTVTFLTVPGAELNIVTQYPNGSVNNSQTLRVKADSSGRYVQRYKLDDFRFLGVFHVSAIANTTTRSANVSEKFVLQTWIEKDPSFEEEVTSYKYPLVP
jgi:hypothetical protein